METTGKKRILVAPLDWGLGHATRCIPVIRELILLGDEVLIACDGTVKQLLKKEFPELTYIPLQGYNIHYSTVLPLSFSMALQVPKILRRIFIEHLQLKKIIHEHRISAVISDNRYGLWNKKIQSVFITHQVMIKCPPLLRFLEHFMYHISKIFIGKYQECWIPDDERKLSGDLSHRFPIPLNAKFIGTLSRWKGEKKYTGEKKYDVIGIVSGPESHRTSFEKILVEQFRNSNLHALVVLGKPGEKTDIQITDRLRLVSHLESKKLLEAILASGLVICRAGYSGIMDLAAIGKEAILVPTPGQTEQVYLAKYLKEKKMFFSIEEKKFRLGDMENELKEYSISIFQEIPDSLTKTISAWRKKISES